MFNYNSPEFITLKYTKVTMPDVGALYTIVINDVLYGASKINLGTYEIELVLIK